jgi:hypothetical protein
MGRRGEGLKKAKRPGERQRAAQKLIPPPGPIIL